MGGVEYDVFTHFQPAGCDASGDDAAVISRAHELVDGLDGHPQGSIDLDGSLDKTVQRLQKGRTQIPSHFFGTRGQVLPEGGAGGDKLFGTRGADRLQKVAVLLFDSFKVRLAAAHQ